MTNFHNLASYNFSEIEEAKGEIKKKVTGWFHVKPIACTHQHLYYSLMNHKEECNNNPILLKHKPLLCFRISQCNSVIEVCALVRLIIIMIMDIHVHYNTCNSIWTHKGFRFEWHTTVCLLFVEVIDKIFALPLFPNSLIPCVSSLERIPHKTSQRTSLESLTLSWLPWLMLKLRMKESRDRRRKKKRDKLWKNQ